ncbi:MAG: ATP-binding cassette domain-containing protein [Lachnospiraceae bacterium]|nr:ATP-binding cassette domain-containing protein [Lachnospiraceae bacterium]
MISISHVDVIYDNADEKVFDDFSLNIENGDFYLVFGKSGSGKSTLIKLLLKEIDAKRGSVFIDGRDITKLRKSDIPFYRREIGVIFQDFKLFQDMNIYDNLATSIMLTGGNGRDAELKITHVLNMLGIDRFHKRFPKELSGGEQQKVCLARAIINNPKILLCDEPTGNLDPTSSKELLQLLKLVHNQGTTIIMATHDIQNIKEVYEDGLYKSITLTDHDQ